MLFTRRRILLKIGICLGYVICTLLVAKFLFPTNDIPNSNRRYIAAQADKEQFFTENDILRHFTKHDVKQYEHWISEYENNIIVGLGENGRAAHLYGYDKVRGDESLKTKALNVALSDRIPLSRNLPDIRDPLCVNVTYDRVLPTASIVIIFYNEPWSVLLRTVHSILTYSPPHLLKEVILVDDHSDEELLCKILDYYLMTRLPKKVRLIRLSEREGLIRARIHGAKNCSGDVIVFLDAHCEVLVDWLRPLLQRIKSKRDAVSIPIIDNISEETFEYLHDNEPSFFQVGGFTWSGHFTWINIQQHELKSRSLTISPVKSPTMAGGLFAINREYFWEIGSYDEKMEGWGGENLEMSFRVWQCGGTLETIPCSRVGHVFRNFHPYKFPNNKDTHGINTARMAYVWMDEYKRLFFLHRSEFKDNHDVINNLQERIDIRKKLGCKSFKWYLDNIYPEKFIPDENVIAYGRIQLQSKELCLDNLQHDEDKPYFVGLYGCHKKLFPSQFFSLSITGELRREETCAKVIESNDAGKSQKVQMVACSNISEEKQWSLNEEGNIIHVASGLCLDGTNLHAEEKVYVSICDGSRDQFWNFDFYDKTLNTQTNSFVN